MAMATPSPPTPVMATRAPSPNRLSLQLAYPVAAWHVGSNAHAATFCNEFDRSMRQ